MRVVMQYTIRPYDTIWMLAQVFNTTVESIMDLNPGINPTNLQIGQVISIAPGYRYYPTRNDGRVIEPMPNGMMPNGQMPNGAMPNGMMPNGQMPNGMMPNGQMPNGMMPNGAMPNGMMPNGAMPNGMMPNGPMPNGTMPNGTIPNGTTPGRPMPNGTIPNRTTPGGTMPGTPTPIAPTPIGPTPIGPTPIGPTPNGMTPNGSINTNQTNMPRMNGQMPGEQMPNGNMRDGMDDDMDYMGFMDTYNHFRMLWGQHYFWTMYVIEALIFDLPTLDAATERLMRNPTDFANALVPYYGEEAATEFSDLFTEHLTIAVEVIQAAKAGDNNGYNEAQERWHENADQIAAFLGNLNPNWSEEDWDAMLYDHLDLLTAAVGDLLSENYTQAISIYDDIELQTFEMGDMFVEGILTEVME